MADWTRFDVTREYNGDFWLSGRKTKDDGCVSTYRALVSIVTAPDGTGFDIQSATDGLGEWHEEYGLEWVMPFSVSSVEKIMSTEQMAGIGQGE